MSRSYKKHPGGKDGNSDKADKEIASRKQRRYSKKFIQASMSYTKVNPTYEEDELLEYPIENLGNSDFKTTKEQSNVYNFSSDGGSYYATDEEATKYPKLYKRK